MFRYGAYGLGIDAALPLPELVARDEASNRDVVVRLGRVGYPLPKVLPDEVYSRATADEVLLVWKDAGAFLVRGGREIVVDPLPGVEERVLRLCILGPALGVLLRQRGRVVLHASAIDVAGGAVAFLGEAGWGKSTMAAALHSQGHRVVTDDVTALQVDKDYPVVFPGFPQLKLWPEALVALGDVPERMPWVEPNVQKRARRSIRGFSLDPLPLRCVYVLAFGETQQIEPLGPRDALVELVRHSYGARVLKTVETSSHFLQCAGIVNSVAVRRLKRPRSLEALPDLALLVEEDLAREANHSSGGVQSQ